MPTLDEQAGALLADPKMNAALLLKMGLDDSRKTKSRGEDGVSSGNTYYLTPSGNSTGSWPFPPFWPPSPFPGYPPAPAPYPKTGSGPACELPGDLPGPSTSGQSARVRGREVLVITSSL